MAFDGGAVKGRAILDDSKWTAGSKNVAKSTKGMTGSVFKAQIAFAALNKVVQVISKTVKDSINAFIKQQKVEAQLNAVLKSTKNAAGLTAKEIKNMAAQLQNATTFGDETIISAQNMLLTFTQIGKDVFPQATEALLNMSEALGQDLKQSTIQLGKALNDPIQGVTALRRVGIQLTEAQEDQIKQFVKLGDVASAQKVILGELETQFGGSARAARDTLGGALEALANKQGDLQEKLGGFINVIGRDMVEGLITATSKIEDFVTSTDGIDKISSVIATTAGAFEVLKVVLKDLVSSLFEPFKEFVTDIGKEFKDLFSDVSSTITVFDVLSIILEGINIAFGIMLKVIRLVIQPFFSLANIMKAVIELGVSMFQALKGEGDLKTILANAKAIGTTYIDEYKGMANQVKDLVNETIKEFGEIPKNADENGKKLESTWTKTFENTKKKIVNALSGIGDKIKEVSLEGTEDVQSFNQVMLELFADGVKKVTGKLSFLLGAFKDAFNSISSIITESLNNDLDALKAKNQDEIDELESQKDSKIESFVEETEAQKENLIAQRESNAITEEEFEERMKALEERRAMEKDSLDKKLTKGIDDRRKKQLEKENAAEKKAFQAEKANKIAGIWLQAAIGIVGAWAQSS
jgi:hypothetical protein